MQTKKENIKLEKPLYPKLVSDLAAQNQFLRITTFSLIGVVVLFIILICFSFSNGPKVIALDTTGSIAPASKELHQQHIEAAVKQYLQFRYSWEPESVATSLKKAEEFVLPSYRSAFQKSMVEILKFVKDRKVRQRIYVREVSVQMEERQIRVSADRITELEGLKAATTLTTKINFDISEPTERNPWGVFFVKEIEGGN